MSTPDPTPAPIPQDPQNPPETAPEPAPENPPETAGGGGNAEAAKWRRQLRETDWPTGSRRACHGKRHPFD